MSRRPHHARAMTVLGWTFLGFVALQVALNLYVDGRHPEWYDAEFGARLETLRARMAEAPGRPLLLLVGSSRTEMNFLPEQLPPLHTPSGARPLAFNFSHLGAGPVMNLVEVKRLLRSGVHPTWLIVEVMPSQLGDDKQRILTATAAAGDLPLVRRYVDPIRTWGIFCRSRLTPCYRHRMFLLDEWLPRWLPKDTDTEQEQIRLGALGGDYEWQAQKNLTAAEVARRTKASRNSYLPALEKFQMADISVRAMHELLALCQREHIQTLLLLSPESAEFRSWYPPAVWQQIESFCRDLSRDYAAPLIDARDWLADGDFADSHHVQLAGAEKFTRRLGQEVLQPLVAGKLPPPLRSEALAKNGATERR